MCLGGHYPTPPPCFLNTRNATFGDFRGTATPPKNKKTSEDATPSSPITSLLLVSLDSLVNMGLSQNGIYVPFCRNGREDENSYHILFNTEVNATDYDFLMRMRF